MNINQVNLVGRVGRDPEVKQFESGSIVCKLTLAVERRTKSSEPDWFNVEMWGKTAEIASNYVKKGSLIGITGALKFEHWQDSENRDRATPVVKVDRLDLLGSKREEPAA